MSEVRYVEYADKAFWFGLDRHLPESEFERKVRDRQGYVILDIPGYEQPMEMFLCKGL